MGNIELNSFTVDLRLISLGSPCQQTTLVVHNPKAAPSPKAPEWKHSDAESAQGNETVHIYIKLVIMVMLAQEPRMLQIKD